MRYGCLAVVGHDKIFPVKIGPGEAVNIPVRCDTHHPGDFSEPIIFFTTAPGFMQYPLRVEGKIVPWKAVFRGPGR